MSELIREALRHYERRSWWDDVNADGRAQATRHGIREQDVDRLAHEVRASTRANTSTNKRAAKKWPAPRSKSLHSAHSHYNMTTSRHTMKQMPAGEFKAQCLAVMDQVFHSGEPVLITKHGKPVAKLIPAEKPADDLFGYMAGKVKIVGDIVGPATPLEDWESK